MEEKNHYETRPCKFVRLADVTLQLILPRLVCVYSELRVFTLSQGTTGVQSTEHLHTGASSCDWSVVRMS